MEKILKKLLEPSKPKQSKLVHGLKESKNSNPLQKTVGKVPILHNTLLEERSLSHVFGQESMKVPFSKEDPLIKQMTPIHIKEEEEDGGYNAVTSRAYLVPHAEEGGAHAPIGGILVSLQEIPQDLTCGRQSTINE